MLKKGDQSETSNIVSLSGRRGKKESNRSDWYKFVARINFYQEDVVRDGNLEQMRFLLEAYLRSIDSRCISHEMRDFLREKSFGLMKAIAERKKD